ncbi:MAG: penicillin-binding protein activator LpoB [Treponemataceae bacterium]|nr:penicillin-binding protein activator LpoB [Treponemataceae bacterium]
MKKLLSTICVLFVFASVFAAPVKRADSGKDLNGYWNENDVQLVCESIIDQVLNNRRIARFEDDNDRLPIVVIGQILNESSEYIDTSIIEKKLQNAIINSGVMDFVAESSERDILREEIRDQSDHASADTAKDMDEEDAADFMLTGNVKSLIEYGKKESQRTYYITIQMTDIQSHRVIFSGEEKIIKLFKTPKKRI